MTTRPSSTEGLLATIPATEARQQLPDLIDQAAYGGARIAIAKHGKPMAVLISYSDLQRLEALEDAHDLALYQQAMAESTELPLSFDEYLKELQLSPDDLKGVPDA
jgi:prevent-host-death family protein